MVGGGGEGKISKLARVVLGNRSGKVQVLQECQKKLKKFMNQLFSATLLGLLKSSRNKKELLIKMMSQLPCFRCFFAAGS